MTANSINNLRVFQSIEFLHKAAAEFIIETANAAIAAKGRFTIALSGGQTPEKLYSLLAEPPYSSQLQWDKTFIFWGDERCVPFDDERNNAHQAKLLLLDKINIPPSNIYCIPVNLPPAEAANKYEQEINNFFGDESPSFDIILLGLGNNGHTASLFPHTKVIDEQAAGVREVYVKEEKMYRITMTAPLINQAHHLLFLITGENKAPILEKIFNTPYQPDYYPAQLIYPKDGALYWFVDKAAASLIQNVIL